MYQLQVLESDRYKMLADENRINMRLLPPPRGRILDRFGHPLAANRENYRALIVAEQTPDSALRAVDRAYLPGIAMYGAVFVLAFFSPLASVVLTFAIAAFYLPSAALFDRGG